MRLPDGSRALVDRRKVVEYLLNPAHPDNGGKASFFEALGFSIADPDVLVAALASLGAHGQVTAEMVTDHGQKYVVDGGIQLPDGTVANVRSVWIVDRGQQVPRLVTAYPSSE